MRTLLTGGLGFIGSHFLEHALENTDDEFVVLDSLTYAGDMTRVLDIRGFDSRRVSILWHDLRAPINLALARRIGDIDTVINMAAESHVDRSISDPVPFIHNNVSVATTMLEWARVAQPRVFIQVSTDEVYGAAPDGYSHREWDVIAPSNPYAASKACQEAIGFSYWRTYGVPLIVTSTMNNFGERQHSEKFIPMVVKHLLDGKPMPVHGQETEAGWVGGSRMWLHARNHADALLFLAERGAEPYSGIPQSRPVRFNVVGDMDLRNDEVVGLAAEILGVDPLIKWTDYHSTRPGHDLRYSLDGTALRETGWKPPVDFHDSFAKCIRWMAEHPSWL